MTETVTEQLQDVRVRYLRREGAARYIGCSLRQLDELKHDGEIPFYRLGRRLIVFRIDDLEAFMDRCRVVPPGLKQCGPPNGGPRRSELVPRRGLEPPTYGFRFVTVSRLPGLSLHHVSAETQVATV